MRSMPLRNADAVGLEVLDKFLRGADRAGLTVLLAGVRPDLLAALHRFEISTILPAERIFPEEEEHLSATLKAIRHAVASRAASSSVDAPRDGVAGSYYLV